MPSSIAPIGLDADAVRLLEAMHRGCTVRLDDGDGLRWHIEPRIVVPMQLYGDDDVTLVDLHGEEMGQGVAVGTRRHMPDWPMDDPYLRLGAGILLIRTSLAVRKGILLVLTPLGRSLATSRIGAGVDIAGRAITDDPDVTAPEIEITKDPIEMMPFEAVEAEQRITIIAVDRRSAIIRFEAGGRRADAIIERRDADLAFATLAAATEQQTRCLVPLSDTTRLLKGGRGERIEIETMQDFDRAIAALHGPDVETFVTGVRRALDGDVTTVLQPVAVAYGRFDVVLSEDALVKRR